jgi:hypothetical protein
MKKILVFIICLTLLSGLLISLSCGPVLAANGTDIFQTLKLDRLKNKLKGSQVITDSDPKIIGKKLTALIFKTIISISGDRRTPVYDLSR